MIPTMPGIFLVDTKLFKSAWQRQEEVSRNQKRIRRFDARFV
jgi:hypothetical protein